MSRKRWAGLTAALAGAALAVTACGTTGEGGSAAGSGDGGGPVTGLQIMVPTAPGGGYDVTARTAAKAMEDAEIARNVQVSNLSGAGGTVALQRLVNEDGNGDLAMMMGLGVVGAVYTNQSEATLADATPLARLIEESGGVFVSADSPYQTLDDLVAAWTADPAGVSVGGGSSPGGPDHLLPMQLAEAVGIDPAEVNYVGYDGGGDLLPAILGSKVAFGASGYTEFIDQVNAGELRMLAVTGVERLDVLPDVPTLQEQGVDMTFTNWRGLVAPPGIDEVDNEALIASLTEMHDSVEWQEAVEANGWTDAFITGEEFADFLTEQDQSVADTLSQLGLA